MEKEKKRLEKQLKYILEIDQVKMINRQNYLADGSRRENDGEHSFHLAIMAPLLTEYFYQPVDVAHVMEMVLVHDVVEVDAGDTYAYDEMAAKDQKIREAKGARRIFGLLPEDQKERYCHLFQEFDRQETPEAKYARVLDNLQPFLLNSASGGRSWREHGVKRSQIEKRNEMMPKVAPKIWEYMVKEINRHIAKGNIIDE